MCFQGGYGTENTFENVSIGPSVYQSSCFEVFLHLFRHKDAIINIKGCNVHFKVNSAVQFEEILQSYIDAVNIIVVIIIIIIIIVIIIIIIIFIIIIIIVNKGELCSSV